MSFADLGLSEKVLGAVAAAGYTEPTPIQAQAIPHVLARRDVLGIAQTGTGKTAAFTLPMLTLLETGRARARMPRTLILEPTRELAAQVEENFERYGTNHKLNVALIIGGVSFADQDAKLTRGTDVLIATPGRLLDHFERGKLLLTGVELLVIDEADRMLDMGFIPDIERIVKMVPFTRQTLFFSATMPPEIERLADMFLSNPQRVEVARPASTAATIVQRLVATGSEGRDKRDRLRRLIRGEETELKNGIIFCNRKRDVAMLQKSLVSHGFNAAALHGDMDQRARMAALDAFRSGETPLLVASDVAARGLDIPAVSHVFNFDIPRHPEDYVHRIGRTGRAGRAGAAFTLVSPGDDRSLQAIETLIGQPIAWLDGDLSSVAQDGGEAETATRHRGGRSGRGEGRRGGGEARSSRSRQRGDRGAEAASAPEPIEARREAPEERDQGSRRREARPEREEARPRPESRPEPRHEPRQGRPRRRDEEEGETPAGLGDHVPAFLLRPARVPKAS
ncbi:MULTISPECIES: DEAD/DEAH box helicase [Methylobacterium]|uniref:ATP-dependent RNA helicase RhlE n=2 Tax=Pseudomonadota TaxID=1224 RepID=A0ABQ4SW51_9HYPH|nr:MULTISPECIES: DEAD/DEAH box helicase [Methylobacterium]PIU04932.1 MAG: DEAD/DEAH box helicase [Methylobacterium sp. CG09_land_8_20_14_0_10_71_15]PIU11264.1 MAG: DEAD/DEAH box helicase [Methylobacterium sp. CG08_land_8_20_14_0_20_71_15]GJE06730.1 ATP-dependent RNA helicase RhlE [Methylobacterium jeotgali]